MNHTEILLGVIQAAKWGGALAPMDAISHVAVLIDRLDPESSTYHDDLQILVGIGACLWLFETTPF